MANVTVNAQLALATTHGESKRERDRRSQTTQRADDACNFVVADQLNWNWKPKLQLSSRQAKTSWAEASQAEHEQLTAAMSRERSAAGKSVWERESAPATRESTCYCNRVVACEYTLCGGGGSANGDGNHTHVHCIYLRVRLPVQANGHSSGECSQSAQWSSKLTARSTGTSSIW